LKEGERGRKIAETQCLTCFKTSKVYKKYQEQKAIIILFFIDFLCLCVGSIIKEISILLLMNGVFAAFELLYSYRKQLK